MATITGTITTPLGSAALVQILFTPQSTPQVVGSNTMVTQSFLVTADANGVFSQAGIGPGSYLVTVLGDQFTIAVPNDSNSYNITSLITGGTVISNLTVNSYDTLAQFRQSVLLAGEAHLYGILAAGDIQPMRVFRWFPADTQVDNSGSVIVPLSIIRPATGSWLQVL